MYWSSVFCNANTLGALLVLCVALIIVIRTPKRSKSVSASDGSGMRVAFVHPDLGIGGAERLVVDAALAMKSLGHTPVIWTAHHDPGHSFGELIDGTISVKVHGDWLPRSTFGYLHVVWAYARMLFVATVLVLSRSDYDVIFCDQISVCIPILQLTGAKVMFYCHYPDQLLVAGKPSWVKTIYRMPINWLEEKTTGMADLVVVNSKYTASVFRSTFTSLHVTPAVLYPSINFQAFDGEHQDSVGPEVEAWIPARAKTVLLSLNRYERKKGIRLAIDAMAQLRSLVSPYDFDSVHLVIAGGYDNRVAENREHYEELKAAAKDGRVEDHVTFVRSCSDSQKLWLLERCSCLLYTPVNEHFGIVPLEAMYKERMVIAMASGGPLETVEDGVTGKLCNAQPSSWANTIKETAMDEERRRTMGLEGRRRVTKYFSFAAFTQQLGSMLEELAGAK